MHHNLDIHPIPEGKVLFVNEPSLSDANQEDEVLRSDAIRVYIPLDLTPDMIMNRFYEVFKMLGPVREQNELYYKLEVDRIIKQLEIYDQIRVIRDRAHAVKIGEWSYHSEDVIRMAKEIVAFLSENDGTAELFPYELIEQLKNEYGV